jgi:hypothetical protein
MFRRLRLVVRGEPPARGRQMSRPGAANGARGMMEGKALVAAALSHPPAWTNPLPVADPSGRAANARAIVPLPSGTRESGPEAVPGTGEGESAKGGQEWRSSTAPR